VLEIRRCQSEADEALSLEIYNAVVPTEAVSLEESRAWKAAQREYLDLVGTLDGEPAGSAVIGIRGVSPLTLLTVLPEKRRQGIGSALYQAVSDWARPREVESISTRVAEDDDESFAFARRRGFVEHGRERRLVLDLAEVDPKPTSPPDGIRIVRWSDRPELAHGIHEVALEAHPDVPGSEEWSAEGHEEWLARQSPERMFVALAGEEVVGFAQLSVNAASPQVAVHRMTGVKRAFRRRGIAAALKRAQIAWAAGEGFERLETTNEVRNEPILGLNRRLGYREVPGRIMLKGPLATVTQT
jgi:GNAT superfamily N-acetyltransferase